MNSLPRLMLGALLILPALAPGLADDEIDTSDPFSHARLGLGIADDGDAPFRLVASYSLRGKPGRKSDGHYELWWAAADRWHESLEHRGYSRVREADGERVLEFGSSSYEPLRVLDLERLLSHATRGDRGDGRRARPGRTTLIELGRQHGPTGSGPDHEIPRGADGGGLASGTSVRVREHRPAFRSEFAFKQQAQFRGRAVPRRLELRLNGHLALRVSIERLETLEPSEPWPEPHGEPSRAFPVRCDRPRPARIERFATIHEPRDVGRFAARFTVGRDGAVHDLVVLRSDDTETERYFIDHLRQREWSPALCGDVPLDSIVSYTLDAGVTIGDSDAAPGW